MIRVKICGITNLEDAKIAIEAGADALGFVFYEKSPRYITPKRAKEIVKELPPFVEKVGLFVNATCSEVNATCKETGMSLVQIHFEADSEFFKGLEVPHLKVVRAACKDDIEKYKDEYRIVDAFVKSYGGEGKRVDIDWFKGVDTSKIILAGGLTCSNIKEVRDLGFYGLDVSSGVEKSRGKKDRKKIEEFLRLAKN
jgi:phosphoribosylanthranilate isomerase